MWLRAWADRLPVKRTFPGLCTQSKWLKRSSSNNQSCLTTRKFLPTIQLSSSWMLTYRILIKTGFHGEFFYSQQSFLPKQPLLFHWPLPSVELFGHDFLLSQRISFNSPRSTPRAEHDSVLHTGIPLMWQEFGQEIWAGIYPVACIRHKFLRASSLCQMRAKIRFKTTMQSCQEGL